MSFGAAVHCTIHLQYVLFSSLACDKQNLQESLVVIKGSYIIGTYFIISLEVNVSALPDHYSSLISACM